MSFPERRDMAELKAYWDEEAKCFREYNDEFDLTIHFETEEDKDEFIRSMEFQKRLKEDNAKLKEAVEKIKEEIKDMSFEYQLVKRTEFVGYAEWKEEAISLDNALEIIDKHTEGLI